MGLGLTVETPDQKASVLIREDPRVEGWLEGGSAFSMGLDFALQADRVQTALQFQALDAGVGHIVPAA